MERGSDEPRCFYYDDGQCYICVCDGKIHHDTIVGSSPAPESSAIV